MLSEGAASLLPDVDRPALLWTIRLDARGEPVETGVVKALVRSREQLSYQQAQVEIDGGEPRETLALLVEVGRLRDDRERDRGGVSLQVPAQEIRVDAMSQPPASAGRPLRRGGLSRVVRGATGARMEATARRALR